MNVFNFRWCMQTVPLLTAIEEHQVGIVLDTLRNEVERRRISLYQYFKDFDRVFTHADCTRKLHLQIIKLPAVVISS